MNEPIHLIASRYMHFWKKKKLNHLIIVNGWSSMFLQGYLSNGIISLWPRVNRSCPAVHEWSIVSSNRGFLYPINNINTLITLLANSKRGTWCSTCGYLDRYLSCRMQALLIVVYIEYQFSILVAFCNL
jgi:hypothetical protein